MIKIYYNLFACFTQLVMAVCLHRVELKGHTAQLTRQSLLQFRWKMWKAAEEITTLKVLQTLGNM